MVLGATVLTVGLGCAAALLFWNPVSADLLGGSLVLSPVTRHLKFVLVALSIVAAWFCTESAFTRHVGEFMALVALATAGLMFLVGTENLLVVFVALELAGVSLYAMTAFDKRGPRPAEAALRYFLFGGIAAAATLYGFGLLYGLGGSLRLPVLAAALAGRGGDPLVQAAIVLVVSGFGFKIAAVPFHLWAPDAYEGAPAPAAAFIASGSKIAGFFVLWKLLQGGLVGVAGNAGWKSMEPGWLPVVALVAAASMVFGTLAALAQTGLRRLMAYSAVAHAGYALLALAGGSQPALLYYAVTYALAATGAFGVIAILENRAGGDSIANLAGLRERSPLLAVSLTVFVLSLAGIPPLAGFIGKLGAFVAVSKLGAGQRHGWLVVVALASSCVSLYYYLRILRQVWIAPGGTGGGIRAGVAGWIAAALALATLLLGCDPERLLRFLR